MTAPDLAAIRERDGHFSISDQHAGLIENGIAPNSFRDAVADRRALLGLLDDYEDRRAALASQPEPLDVELSRMADQWDLKPGDTHTVEPRYRRETWMLSNARGDSLAFEPNDAADLLDYIAARLLETPR